MSADNPAAPGPRIVSTPSTPVVMGSAAPAVTQALPSVAPPVAQVEVQEPETAPTAVALPEPSAQPEELRLIVLKALSEAGQRMVASMLETGEWKVEGNEVVIKVASSATVIDMSFGADAKRILIATASGFLGRPMKAKVLPGGTVQKVRVLRHLMAVDVLGQSRIQSCRR